MVESGAESTPLLLDSLSPPTNSPLSRNYVNPSSSRAASRRSRFGGNGYPAGSRASYQRQSQVHPSHRNSLSSRHMPSSRQFSSSAVTTSLHHAHDQPSSSSATHQTVSVPTSNKIWQIVVSLPHNCLCFASPICSPFCGLCCCLTCIRTSEYGVLQRFGKFDRILDPGLHVLKWPMEREAGRISMRIRQLDLNCETKSKDHVFLRVHVSIQYQTNATHLFESFYSLTSPTRQLSSHTYDIIRSTLPQLDLDDIFSSQDSIASELHSSLNSVMNEYGYMIHHALITKIWPNDHVKASMNEMEASKRMKEAMPQKAEAVRIQAVKDAEARAERAHLIGIGVARERREIARGMRDVVDDVIGSSAGSQNVTISSKGAMDLLMLTQYFDVLADLSGHRGVKKSFATWTNDNIGQDEEEGPSTSLFLTHMPETVTQLADTARRCFGSDTVTTENLLEL